MVGEVGEREKRRMNGKERQERGERGTGGVGQAEARGAQHVSGMKEGRCRINTAICPMHGVGRPQKLNFYKKFNFQMYKGINSVTGTKWQKICKFPR